jgi:hypothetical protein
MHICKICLSLWFLNVGLTCSSISDPSSTSLKAKLSISKNIASINSVFRLKNTPRLELSTSHNQHPALSLILKSSKKFAHLSSHLAMLRTRSANLALRLIGGSARRKKKKKGPIYSPLPGRTQQSDQTQRARPRSNLWPAPRALTRHPDPRSLARHRRRRCG